MLRKAVTVLLCLFMIAGSVIPQNNQGVYAFDISEEETLSEEAGNTLNNSEYLDPTLVPVDFEDTSKRTENEKYFRKIDGTYEVAIYNQAVHYYDQGEWKDINNTLSYEDGEDTYENASNAFKIKFPKNLDANKQIKLKYNDYTIDWNILNIESSIIETENEKLSSSDIKELTNVSDSVLYSNIKSNLDIEYILSGSSIKENIILNEYIKDFSLTFEYKVKGLVLDYSDSNDIVFEDENGNPVFSLSELYMFDSNGDISYNVNCTIIETDSKTYEISISADEDWLKNASYPVTIDPTLYSSSTTMNIYDTYIREAYPTTNYSSLTTMVISDVNSYDEYRGLIYFYIPSSIMDQVITYSYLSFAKYNVSNNAQINLYKNTESFASSSATWNNAPEHETSVTDYYTVNSYTPFMFDITEAVKEWQATGNTMTTGFTLALDDYGYGSYNAVYQNGISNSSLKPLVTIGYEDPSGLKDYWTYTSQNIGFAGTGYISDYSGNLSWVRDEYNLENEYMALSLSFFYNNFTRSEDIGYGAGWRTNYNMQISHDTLSDSYYMLKPDGSKVYFLDETINNIIPEVYEVEAISEDGSRMEFYMLYDEGYVYYHVTTSSDIRYYFDENGRLYRIQNLKTYHDLNIYYIDSTSQKIDYITDDANNRIEFTYSGDRLYKTELQLKQSDSSLRGIERRYYYYDTYGNLNYINYDYRYGTDDDYWTTDLNDKLDYYFDSDNKLIYAYCYQDNYKVQYSYDTNYKVQNIMITDDNLNIGNTEVVYETNRTTYTDYEGDNIYYTFDSYGHTISIMDDYGNCTYYRYSGLFTNLDDLWDHLNGYNLVNIDPNYYNNHNLIESSDVIKQQQNALNNHSFEEGNDGWTLYEGSTNEIEYTNSEATFGNYSLALTKNDSSSVYASQSVYLEAGSYYITAWIKNDGTTTGAYVDVIGETFAATPTKLYNTDGWEKYSLYFYISSNTTVTIRIINESYSTAFFDNIQLSQDAVDTRYNAILNNSFEESTTYWSMSSAYRTTINETGIMEDILGQYAIYMTGDGSVEKYASQDISDLITVGETYIVGAWAKADAVPNKAYWNGYERSDDRFFGLMVKIECAPTEPGESPYFMYQYLPFNTNIEGWQYQMLSFDVPDIAHDVVVYAIYQGEGTSYFDNIQLYHDKLSTEYCYNKYNGNLDSISSPDGTVTSYEYDEENNLASVTQDDETINIDRTSTFLIEEIENNNVRTTFEYDSTSKQLIATYVGYDKDASTQDKWFKTTTTYTTDGQYVYSTTDEFGNTSYVNTDYENSLVSSVIDAIGNSQSFEYDRYGNLVSTTANEYGTSDSIVASYDYDNLGRLEVINRDGYYYEFVYNNLDQLLFVRINDGSSYENLMEYDYWEETFGSETYYTNLLKQQTYGNGDYVSFLYTEEDQISSVSFNGTIRYQYEYDSSGRLAVIKDIYNSNIYFYSYDLAGRLEKITDKDGNTIEYTYDEDGNLNHLYYNIGTISRGVTYHYNSTTGEYEYAQYTANSTTIQKNYDYDTDSLKRLDTIELLIGSISFTQEYNYGDYYVDSSMGNATNRVNIVYYRQDGTLQYYYKYYYDDNQNITGIIVRNGSYQIVDDYDYYYDGFNQLIRENIKVDSGTYQRTFVYEYDDQGNIIHIYEYEYTTSSTISTTLLKQTNFDYDNVWADQLTRKRVVVNSVVVEDISYYYDDSGNPTTYYNNLYPSAGQSLSWDGRQLEEISKYCVTMNFKYNSEGKRTQKDYSSCGTSYTVKYVLNGDKIIVEYRGNDTIYYTYNADGSLLSMNYNGTEYFYISDVQGNIIEIVDISGDTVVEYKYDAWGNIVYQTPNQSIGDINPFRYRGYYYDTETGWYYLQSRYYDPEIGRFISADSIAGKIGDILSTNMYAYCANNPVMYVDPTGEAWWHWAAAAAIVVGLGVATALTAGGAMGAVVALTAVANGAAAVTPGLTLLCATFIGASTALAGATIVSTLNSVSDSGFDSDEFAAGGGTALTFTVFGAFTGLLNGYRINANTQIKNNPTTDQHINKNMDKRGWTNQSINNTVQNPYRTSNALNKATGNPATAYFNDDGSYVVVDNYTNAVIQISDRYDPNWVPDSTIENPFIPNE